MTCYAAATVVSLATLSLKAKMFRDQIRWNGITLILALNVSRCSFQISSTIRIGVTSAKNLKLRYFMNQNPFVSGPKYLR